MSFSSSEIHDQNPGCINTKALRGAETSLQDVDHKMCIIFPQLPRELNDYFSVGLYGCSFCNPSHMHFSDPMLEIISPPLHYKPSIPSIPPSLYFRKLWRRGLSIPPLRKACCVSVCACVAVEGGHYSDEELGLVPVDTSHQRGVWILIA